MNIFITGGTGFVGRALSETLLIEGHHLKILSRSKKNDNSNSRLSFIEGDPVNKGEWINQIADCDVVINLAGASIFKRWTAAYKQKLIKSRIDTTCNIVEGLATCKKDNLTFISASAVGYYGFHDDEILDEKASPGTDFLANLSKEWEAAAGHAAASGVRVIINRFGVILGKDGGAVPMMIPLFKYWMGSPLGKNRQYFSWIHIKDLVNIILFQIQNTGLKGAFNCTAPNPVTNREFTMAFASVMKKPLIMPPLPGFLLKLVMGEFADVLLKGQRVIPRRLMDAGYSFIFPDINAALHDIVS